VDFCLLIADTGFVVSFDLTFTRCLSNLPTENSHLSSNWGERTDYKKQLAIRALKMSSAMTVEYVTVRTVAPSCFKNTPFL